MLVVPYWPTQTWWPYLMNMLLDFPLTVSTSTTPTAAPTSQETSNTRLPLIRNLLTSRGISAGAAQIIMQSCRARSQKQYQTYHQRWQEFCPSRSINPISASRGWSGISLSSINTARSALSTVIFLPDGSSCGNHHLVSRFLKGVFELKASLPRYKDIWDVSAVFDQLKTLPPLEELNFKNVTHRTVLLFALLSSKRCQTVHALTVSGMRITKDTVHFEIAKFLKTPKPGKHHGHLELKLYVADQRLCVGTCLKQYVKLRSSMSVKDVVNFEDQLVSTHVCSSKH